MTSPQDRAFDLAMDKAAEARLRAMDAWADVVDAADNYRAAGFEKVAGDGAPTDLAKALLHREEVYKKAAAVRETADALLRAAGEQTATSTSSNRDSARAFDSTPVP